MSSAFLVGGIIEVQYILFSLTLGFLTLMFATRTRALRRDFLLTAVLLLNAGLFFRSDNRFGWEALWMGFVLALGMMPIVASIRRQRPWHGKPQKFLHVAITTWLFMAQAAYTAAFIKVTAVTAGRFPLWSQLVYQIVWMLLWASLLCGAILMVRYITVRKTEKR